MSIVNLSQENFDDSIKAGTTVVNFSSSKCLPCLVVSPIIEDIEKNYKGSAKVARLDVETDENQSIVQDLDITQVPTVILFKNGREISRLMGIHEKREYEWLLR